MAINSVDKLQFLLSFIFAVLFPVQDAINSSQSSTTLLISINGMLWQFFKVHSCACKNGSREPNHAPFRDDLSSFTKFDSSSFSHS